MKFVYQCKGSDASYINELQKYWSSQPKWYWSIKYDGQYVQIHVGANEVILYTSSGKPYKNKAIEDELLQIIPEQLRPIIFEGEYLGEGFGALGGRKEAAVVTTLRAAYSKGEVLSFDHRIQIFDIIDNTIDFEHRLELLQSLRKGKLISFVDYREVSSLDDVKFVANRLINDGMEGLIAKSSSHFQIVGKRVKTALKFKKKYFVEAEVVGITEGTGKYESLIGALVCKDSDGLEFTVGSGLTDDLRKLNKSFFVGKTVKVKYESKGKTYVMPVFVEVL